MVDFVARTDEGRTLSDEEFFDSLAAALEAREAERERRPLTPAQMAFSYALAWLLGAAVLISLVCGVLALTKLLFTLVK